MILSIHHIENKWTINNLSKCTQVDHVLLDGLEVGVGLVTSGSAL